MNDVLLKEIVEALESINLKLSSQVEELERLNENIEKTTVTFRNQTSLSVVASTHNE